MLRGKILADLRQKKGKEVVARLCDIRPTRTQRQECHAAVERAVRDNVFKHEKNPLSVTGEHVKECCEIIDNVFFDGWIKANIEYTTGVNQEGTKCKAGDCTPSYTTRHGVLKKARIQFNADLIATAVPVVAGEITPQKCNGEVCRDIVAILVSVLKHEIVHLIMHHFLPLSDRKAKGAGSRMYKSHGTAFKTIARNIFGQTSCTVALSIKRDTKAPQTMTTASKRAYANRKVMVAMQDGTQVCGIVERANPVRARVRITATGEKWRVPYKLLRFIK